MKTKSILLLFFLMTSGLFASHEEVVRKAFTAPTAGELSSLEEAKNDAICDLTLAEMKFAEVITPTTSFGETGAPVYRTRRGSLANFFFVDKKRNRQGFIIEDRVKSTSDETEESRDLFVFWLDSKETEVKNISIAQFQIAGHQMDYFTHKLTPIRRLKDHWEDTDLHCLRKASSAEEVSAISSYAKAQEASKAAHSALEEATRLLEAEKELQEFLASETEESKSLKERFFKLFSGKHFQYANYGYDDSFYSFVMRDGRVMLAFRENDRHKIKYLEKTDDTLTFFDFKVVRTSSDPEVFEIEAYRGANTIVLRPKFPWAMDRLSPPNGTPEGHAWAWLENYCDTTRWVPYHEHFQGENIPDQKRPPKFADSDTMKVSLTLVEGDEDATLIQDEFDQSFRLLGVDDYWRELYGPDAKPAEYRARKARIAAIGLKAVLREEKMLRRAEREAEKAARKLRGEPANEFGFFLSSSDNED